LDHAGDRIRVLWAAARKARYLVFGLSQVLDRDPGGLPDGIEATVAGLDAAGLRAAAARRTAACRFTHSAELKRAADSAAKCSRLRR
jgi:hypothetical protein